MNPITAVIYRVSQELKKIKNKKSGSGTEDIKRWPYFSALSFIVPSLQAARTQFNLISKKNCLFYKHFLENGGFAALNLHEHLQPFHTSCPSAKTQSGKYKITIKRNKPLTYEQANPPHLLAHRKSWNTWNTSNLFEGLRSSETAVEDIFIRKFMNGTFHGLFVSEIVIKRRHNIIYIAGIIQQTLFLPRRIYFLIGYTEELLSLFLKCPVKLELQSVPDKKDLIFKYI